MNVSTYSQKLEELQRLKAEVRQLEQQAATEAKRMQPISEQDERSMLAMRPMCWPKSRRPTLISRRVNASS